LVLRQVGEHFEIISNGTFLMDTRNGESEKLLVRAALDRADDPCSILIGGLGVGFSLREALLDQRLNDVTVVEIEPEIVRWNREDLAELNGRAVDDERVTVVQDDLLDFLRSTDATYSAICLDIDNGPDWTVTAANTAMYDDAGTELVASRLRPGGVLTVWSAAASPAYEGTLRRHFARVETILVPVSRGEPDVVFVASESVVVF
jgi:spermidine synthase